MNEFDDELRRVLAALQPAIDWPTAFSAADLTGPDVWQQEDPDLFPMSGPQEDYALPPLVLWHEELRLLAENAYRSGYDKFLEPGESYGFVWPPRGALWSSGIWCHAEPDDDSDPDSGDAEVSILQLASWMWYLGVERIGDGVVEDEEPWLMGSTDVDPRLVDYSVFGGDGAHAYVEVLQKVVAQAARG